MKLPALPALMPVLATLCVCASHAASPAEVERFLPAHPPAGATAAVDAQRRDAILARPDPGTDFLRYAFGLQRHAKKLLTAAQAGQLAAVIARHTPAHSRWHDERNTLRCKFNEVMWRHAAARPAEAPSLRAELAEWMRLRMEWTRQEHLAQYRFGRDVWNVLTPEQQAKLIAGEWKSYATLDPGHTRGDATAMLVTRALGQPDRAAEFEAASAAWSKEREPLHAAVTETENNERRIVFAMDLNSEALAGHAALAATGAYAALYLAEADATRRIVQAAYHDPAPRCAQAAAAAWSEAPKRFAGGATELIRLLDPAAKP